MCGKADSKVTDSLKEIAPGVTAPAGTPGSLSFALGLITPKLAAATAQVP